MQAVMAMLNDQSLSETVKNSCGKGETTAWIARRLYGGAPLSFKI
jgi:hypothetical protein